jgi:hypothetical protein
MGCDIHWVIEKKFDAGWAPVLTSSQTFIPYDTADKLPIFFTRYRNYGFFAELAGVRGPGPRPNGLPEDISDAGIIIATDWGMDAHSHGHLSMREFIEKFIKVSNGSLTEATAQALEGKDPVLEFFKDNWIDKEDIDNHRVIFWFDN